MESKKRLDIMTDIETLGTSVDCTIFQIAAMAFDLTTGEIIDSFNLIADISKECVNVSGSTLKWWLNTDKELLTKLLNDGTVSETELIVQFWNWINKFKEEYEVYLWGKGILFDNNIIKAHMERRELIYPIAYNKDRDVRTILELASLKTNIPEKDLEKKFFLPNTVVHDAYDDVKNQINIVHNCYKILIN